MPMPDGEGVQQPPQLPPGVEGRPPLPPGVGEAGQPMPEREFDFGKTYLSVRPSLRKVLRRMEKRSTDENESRKVIFVSATDMDAARVGAQEEDFGVTKPVLWQFRQVWDVTQVLEEDSGIMLLGTSLYLGSKTAKLHNEITCADPSDARDLKNTLQQDSLPHLSKFIRNVLALDHKIKLSKKDSKQPMMVGPDGRPIPMIPGERPIEPIAPPPIVDNIDPEDPLRQGQPRPKAAEPTESQIELTHKDRIVRFELDLLVSEQEYSRIQKAAIVLMHGLRGELEQSTDVLRRELLSNAVSQMARSGIPPGAFPAGQGTTRSANDPGNRISWMAGLLPYLGQNDLYGSINFNEPWNSPSNWLASRTVVPQFLDPRYPKHTRFVQHPGVPFRAAGTHYVGIAGVGLDAAGHSRKDLTKVGVLGYDGSVGLPEIQKQHGASNTILMIQVPHDGLVGVTPWMAGGGATLRGVP